MLIHGRLILTSHSLLLDEVRSLLQKSLRRKERDLVLGATRELLCYGKDQLPWKSLVTFLFEDHCLSDASVVQTMVGCFQKQDKYRAVELLLQCWTGRVAACLPVVTLDPEYDPKHWDVDLEIPVEYQGLLIVSPGEINCARLIAHIVKAWRDKNHTELMTYFKMATMVEDVMQSSVTKKGEKVLIGNVKKPRPTHVFLSILHKETEDAYMKCYLTGCYSLACISDVCLRLILCSVLTQTIFHENVRPFEDLKLGGIKWDEVQRLDHMPSWAVDKHTFRGKYGKGTKHLLKQCPKGMTEEQYEEFHGERPKSGLQNFFDEGCQCEKSALEVNPYWERTKEIYSSKPYKLQKTAHMTKVYYTELLKKYPQIKVKVKKSSGEKVEEDMKAGSRKRTMSSVETKAKRIKTLVSESESKPVQAGATSSVKTSDLKKGVKQESNTPELHPAQSEKPTKGQKQKESAISADYKTLNLPGPLLQLPTGSAKLHACADLKTSQVVKGPYPKHKLAMTRFFYTAMQSLGDIHTMPIDIDGQYVKFELLKGEGAEIKVTLKDFYDAISKQNIHNGQFLTRETLGIVQGHRIPTTMLHNVPMSFWVHYVYRACLNVGDSGLYNAITDSKLTFLYGIDMEEQRKTIHSGSLLDLMFVKKPAKAYCGAIMEALKENKQDMVQLLQREISYEKLRDLANDCEYNFDAALFSRRLRTAQNFVDKL